MLPTERLRSVLRSTTPGLWLFQRRLAARRINQRLLRTARRTTPFLSVISGSVPNSQTASCWVVIPTNGKLAFVSNTGSGTISSYCINPGERIDYSP